MSFQYYIMLYSQNRCFIGMNYAIALILFYISLSIITIDMTRA